VNTIMRAAGAAVGAELAASTGSFVMAAATLGAALIPTLVLAAPRRLVPAPA
jgi:hypothetical protein